MDVFEHSYFCCRYSHNAAGLATSLPQNHHRSLPPISSFYGSHSGSTHQGQAGGDNKVIDLSMNKSVSSEDSEDGEWKGGENEKPHGATILPAGVVARMEMMSKNSPLSETESDEKRDVTTTSISPTADSGIHHCPHCNIFFHDFTMYHLHESLHSPDEEDPFRCPSCQKRCQDRIEFMFHMVWHVKYPHTIPNYEPFKETYQT